MKFVRKELPGETHEKKYKVATVAQAIGRSEGSICGYFSNRGVATKGGITMDQIEAVLVSPARGNAIDWKEVGEIRKNLEERGFEIDYSDEEGN
jgi:hypothetical protein